MSPKIVVLAACMALPFIAAAAQKLNVKPGLWEVTTVSQMSGRPPLPKELMDKMTPQQLAQMEAAMKAEAAKGPQTDTDRECVTQEELEWPFESADAEECEQTIVTATRTTQEVRLVCTGALQGSGVFRITAPTPETM